MLSKEDEKILQFAGDLSTWASLVAQMVKCLPVMGETRVRSLGWEDPLEKERLPTSVFWPGEFHGLYSPWGHKELDMTEQPLFFSVICLPFQEPWV